DFASVWFPRFENERARTNGRIADVTSFNFASRNDCCVYGCQGNQQRHVWGREVEHNGFSIWSVDAGDGEEVRASRSTGCFVKQAFERSLDVSWGNGSAVGELGLGIELEGQGLRVWRKFPRRCNRWNNVQVRIQTNQRLIDQLEQAKRGERRLL